MQVQTNSSSPSFNPYEIQSDPIQVTVAPQLTPSEKRLYNSLMYTQDYQGAKDIIALGFIRTTALEKTDTPQRLLDIKA
ncbi:MAG: hypothetical protein B7X89_03885 [Sulfuricurvum sp. 17-40-25]|nr:MAG: hypothetical protein B7X89_03885 [Sulfuricurvum sp. 17-40-25]